jgi:hypothetical protein
MNNWPKQDFKSMTAYFGEVGENQTSLDLPYELCLAWDPVIKVKRATCNKKCAESLHTIFENTLKTYGLKDIKLLNLDNFGGMLNVRKMRGGNAWSIHSWGAAVDLSPDKNRLKWNKTQAQFAQKEYAPFWEIVEAEGWVSLGRARDFDWMHFQAARL